MRKYYQLLLLLICCCSVGVLLMYKSENNRLKYVLQVVNFFGRKDASFQMRLENNTRDGGYHDYAHPVPVWSTIGNNFYVYAAYWNRKELVPGGEAFAIVVGKRGAVINYKCSIIFDGGNTFTGKFKFQHMELNTVDKLKEYTTYRFFCKLNRDFGSPNSIVFTDISSKSNHEIKLRHIKSKEKNKVNNNMDQVTVCVDMVNFNPNNRFASNQNLLQFFLYHQAIGVDHYLIYNGDAFTSHMRRLIYKAGFNVDYLPFNFPFDSRNATDDIRKILEADCNLRSVYKTRFTLLLSINEFFYSRTRLNTDDSLLRSLQQHSSDILRFEVSPFTICLDNNFKILMDNKMYDPEAKSLYKIFLSRPLSGVLDFSTNGPDGELNQKVHNAILPITDGLIHRYTDCAHIGKDGLYDWRTNVREDFMNNLLALRNEISFLI